MKNYGDLVILSEDSHDIELSLAYATDDNVTGAAIYTKAICLLHKEAAKQLRQVTDILKPLGLTLKIWDAYRPLEAQRKLFECFPNSNYVSHPETGSRPHCRGVAIDLTLVDHYRKELDMGTSFDDFRTLAHHGNIQISETAQKNRLLLAGAMNIAGFNTIQSEWWHYQLPNCKSYPIIDESVVRSGVMG